MKLRLKTAAASIGVVAMSVLPLITLVSCGSEQIQSFDFTKINWDKIQHRDAVVEGWVDGDTLNVKFDDNKKVEAIRVEFIDTPESHKKDASGNWVNTTGEENVYALKGFEFGKQEMPAGTHIRVATTGDRTYNRIVGALFYGDNFSKSYEFNIMSKGLALPFITYTGIGMAMEGETNLLHYMAYPIAEAYNYAKNNKKGIFAASLHEILSTHGSTDTRAVDHVGTLAPRSIYKYLDRDAWK